MRSVIAEFAVNDTFFRPLLEIVHVSDLPLFDLDRDVNAREDVDGLVYDCLRTSANRTKLGVDHLIPPSNHREVGIFEV